MKLDTLRHCGIMPNYDCSAACRHCLYACSATRGGDYMGELTMRAVCRVLSRVGCKSIHIGGGEPFLNFEGLLMLVGIAQECGIVVEYIETNASWAVDESLISERLGALSRAGVNTLCISVDPFHAEYVPYSRPLALAEACKKSGFGYFLWKEQFMPMLRKVSADEAHDRETLAAAIGEDYILQTAKTYGLKIGGRAINIEEEFSDKKPADTLADTPPCRNLASGDHFHVDLLGRYIPPGCTGLVIPLEEGIMGLPSRKYLIYESLYYGGLRTVYDFARGMGFAPSAEGYTSSCNLCFHTRKWLAENMNSPELDKEFYTEALKWYTK